MIIFGVIVATLIGFIFGATAAKKSGGNLIGTLRVDNSIPEEGTQLYLELDAGIPEIKNHDYVTLRVDTKSYISRD